MEDWEGMEPRGSSKKEAKSRNVMERFKKSAMRAKAKVKRGSDQVAFRRSIARDDQDQPMTDLMIADGGGMPIRGDVVEPLAMPSAWSRKSVREIMARDIRTAKPELETVSDPAWKITDHPSKLSNQMDEDYNEAPQTPLSAAPPPPQEEEDVEAAPVQTKAAAQPKMDMTNLGRILSQSAALRSNGKYDDSAFDAADTRRRRGEVDTQAAVREENDLKIGLAKAAKDAAPRAEDPIQRERMTLDKEKFAFDKEKFGKTEGRQNANLELRRELGNGNLSVRQAQLLVSQSRASLAEKNQALKERGMSIRERQATLSENDKLNDNLRQLAAKIPKATKSVIDNLDTLDRLSLGHIDGVGEIEGGFPAAIASPEGQKVRQLAMNVYNDYIAEISGKAVSGQEAERMKTALGMMQFARTEEEFRTGLRELRERMESSLTVIMSGAHPDLAMKYIEQSGITIGNDPLYGKEGVYGGKALQNRANIVAGTPTAPGEAAPAASKLPATLEEIDAELARLKAEVAGN